MGIKSLVKDKKGFTIIEVVLVLAIAGLIFLMVFIAYPALRRNQMDTQRKDDMARFSTAINNYQSNNNGKLPGNGKDEKGWRDFVVSYLNSNGDSFADPDGHLASYGQDRDPKIGYDLTVANETTHGPLTDFDHTIHIYPGATCDGESVKASTGGRKVAFQYKLEGGGTYCGNN